MIARHKNQRRVIDLDGPEGNAWHLTGLLCTTLKRSGMSKSDVEEIRNECLSGNYENVVLTFDIWMNSIVELRTNQTELLRLVK